MGAGDRWHQGEDRHSGSWTDLNPLHLCLCDLGQVSSSTQYVFYPEMKREEHEACTLNRGRPLRLLVSSCSELREVAMTRVKP